VTKQKIGYSKYFSKSETVKTQTHHKIQTKTETLHFAFYVLFTNDLIC